MGVKEKAFRAAKSISTKGDSTEVILKEARKIERFLLGTETKNEMKITIKVEGAEDATEKLNILDDTLKDAIIQLKELSKMNVTFNLIDGEQTEKPTNTTD
jgi:hypothetical protein